MSVADGVEFVIYTYVSLEFSAHRDLRPLGPEEKAPDLLSSLYSPLPGNTNQVYYTFYKEIEATKGGNLGT
jgi:hypothetical protein